MALCYVAVRASGGEGGVCVVRVSFRCVSVEELCVELG